MNEAAAREVLLVRAVETADGAGAVLSAQDRGHAGRAAAELVRWQAADQGRANLQQTYPDFFTENPAYVQFGEQAARTVEVPGGPHTVEMLQTLRDAYTRAVVSGEGDLQQALTEAADKVTTLAGQ